jgi:diguanylate cyclase (GGDEF)-like protein/PAS domain S-box-containing protein
MAAKLLLSESHAQERELEIKAVLGSVGEGILTINEWGEIESFNTAATQIFGYTAGEVIGKNITMLMPGEMHSAHQQGMQRYLAGGAPRVLGRQGIELPGLKQDGTVFSLALTVNEIVLERGRIFVGIVRDITERKQLEEKLTFLAQNDTLTGLANRAMFMDKLTEASLRANRNKSALGVMFLDLDGFKQVNDTLGHHNGDELLKQFAMRLTATVRKTDTVARLGGDEFTILLEGMTVPELDVEAVADKLIAAIQPPFVLGDSTIVVTTSIGLALHIQGEFNAEDLLHRADSAMYMAKNSGKNRWRIDNYEDKTT